MTTEASNYNDKLLKDLSDNREALEGMLETIKDIREKTTELLPKSTDFKNRNILEEKMKAISSVFGVELDIRKQKENSIKTELELRRKLHQEERDISSNDINTITKALELAITNTQGRESDDLIFSEMDIVDSEEED